MKPFLVTLAHPPGYVHAQALAEAVEYLHAELVGAGFAARVAHNEIDPASYNVVFCAHTLDAPAAARLPADSIVFNGEQLADVDGWHFRTGVYRPLLARHHVWDYSPVNLPHLGHERASVIPFLYNPVMARGRPRRPGGALLFYGVITPHRRRVLGRLAERGVPVDVVSGFGPTRDAWMFRCRAVLNLHKTEDKRVFEPVRCFYPLSNGVPVVSEETTDPAADVFRSAMTFVDDIAEADLAGADTIDPASFRATTARSTILAAVERFLHGPTRSLGG
jgi:hypothetical protein